MDVDCGTNNYLVAGNLIVETALTELQGKNWFM